MSRIKKSSHASICHVSSDESFWMSLNRLTSSSSSSCLISDDVLPAYSMGGICDWGIFHGGNKKKICCMCMTCYLHIPWGEYVIEEYFMGEICCMKYVVCVCIFMCHRGNMWLRDMYMKYAGKTWVSWSRLGICQWDMTIRRDSLMWDITHSHEQRLIRIRHDAVFTDLTRDRVSRMTHDSDIPTCIEASLIRTCHDSFV